MPLSRFVGIAAWRYNAGMKPVRTPCIGICSTTSVGDRICRGCKRFAFEVIHWNSYTEEQKRAVQARIDQFTSQLMADKFRIHSVTQLTDVLADFRVFYDPDLSPYFWLHQLLQKHAHRLSSLEEAGVSLQPAYRGWDLRDLLLLINEQLQVLSEAHYERYFQANQRK
ncbi:MAG TPA: DUF1289 domain-containing protein [Burkholderiaceae bacterium]|nr:DUF1289 domain-containing protein [Burkholderiaceae bacterium]